MSMAGIWTAWRTGTPEERRSFSIMTTSANEFMAKIHDRLPVILDPKHFDEWLKPKIHEPDQIDAILKSFRPKWLESVSGNAGEFAEEQSGRGAGAAEDLLVARSHARRHFVADCRYLGADLLDCTVGDKNLLQVRTTDYKCESGGPLGPVFDK